MQTHAPRWPHQTREENVMAYKPFDLTGKVALITGGNSGILISAGQLAEIKLKDNLLAAAYYRRATQAKTVPWFAYFMCARTMWEAGQKKEAYEWYRTQWLGKLKKGEDGAPDDLERLRFMEDELKVPVQLRIPRQTWEK